MKNIINKNRYQHLMMPYARPEIFSCNITMTMSTVIKWSLNEEGSLNNLAVGPCQLQISLRYFE